MTAKRAFRDRLTLATLLVTMAACYNSVPLGMGMPEPNARIVATLTDIGAERMAGTIGSGVREIEAIVSSATDSIWQLRLVRVDQRSGTSTHWNRELVSFPRSALTNPTGKRIDRKKSWLFASAIAIGAFVAERFLVGAFAGEEERGPPAPPAP